MDFDLNVKYMKNCIAMGSPEMETIRACARESSIAVSLGFSENDNNSLYIAQVLIGADGEIKVHRRKMKATHMERTIFGDASGQCLQSVAQLPFARVGALSCWEHIHPLLKYNTMAQKEEIHVAAWPVLGPHAGGVGLWSMSDDGKLSENTHSRHRGCDADVMKGCATLSRTYAIEAGAFVLHCTTSISQKGIDATGTTGAPLMSRPSGGQAAVFGPDGRRLTEPLDEKFEGILYADLDMDAIGRTKMFADCTGHYSRPDLLWLQTDPSIKTPIRSGASTLR